MTDIAQIIEAVDILYKREADTLADMRRDPSDENLKAWINAGAATMSYFRLRWSVIKRELTPAPPPLQAWVEEHARELLAREVYSFDLAQRIRENTGARSAWGHVPATTALRAIEAALKSEPTDKPYSTENDKSYSHLTPSEPLNYGPPSTDMRLPGYRK